MAEAATFEPYVKVRYSVLDSPASLCVKPTAATLLIDFMRRWLTATSDGKIAVGGITFTYTTFPRPISRETFGKARAELIAKGFIRPVNERVGFYAWSEAWRDYVPTKNEQDDLADHETARLAQASKTAQFRKSSDGKPDTTQSAPSDGKPDTTPEDTIPPSDGKVVTSANDLGDGKPDTPQCRKTRQSLVTEKPSHCIKSILGIKEITTTTNQTLSPEVSPVAGGGGGGDASPEFEKAKAEYEAKLEGAKAWCRKNNGAWVYESDPDQLDKDAIEQLQIKRIFPPTIGGGAGNGGSAQPEPEDGRTDAECIAERLGLDMEIVDRAIGEKGTDWAIRCAYHVTHSKGVKNPPGLFIRKLESGFEPTPVNGCAHTWLRQREGAIF